jgi:prepilin-type N-terminal cleavage/methylation domain-containing protein
METVMNSGGKGISGGITGQRGFTVVEIAVALTILTSGSAVLWYGLRSAAALDKVNRLHHAAVLAARSDLETLRARPKQDIHDTAYLAAGTLGDSLLVVRTVMDSARIVDVLDEIVLDENLSPKELRKPLEVKTVVYRLPMEEAGRYREMGAYLDQIGEAASLPSGGTEEGDGGPRILASLILKLPEYRWY